MKRYIKSSYKHQIRPSYFDLGKYRFKYFVAGYYGSNYRGLADDLYTDDYDEAIDKCHEFCSQGHYVVFTNLDTGKEFRCDPDTWMENIELGDYPQEAREVFSAETIEEPEEHNLRVCEHCLAGIESHEGPQYTKAIYVDEDDPEESRCEWCEEEGFDVLYEFI